MIPRTFLIAYIYSAIIRRKFCQLARNSLEMTKRTGYLALTGEVAEWSKALPC